MNQQPLIHDYTPVIVVRDWYRTDRGVVETCEVHDDDDDNCPLCDHGLIVCDECEVRK